MGKTKFVKEAYEIKERETKKSVEQESERCNRDDRGKWNQSINIPYDGKSEQIFKEKIPQQPHNSPLKGSKV